MSFILLLIVAFLAYTFHVSINGESRNKSKKDDDFLSELGKTPEQYQYYFEKIESIADGKIWLKYIVNPEFAVSDEAYDLIKKEEEKLEHIYEEAKVKGLNQIVLLVLYIQYLMADPLLDQGNKKSYWVSASRNRQSLDSFPDHNYIAHRLSVYGYIHDVE